MTAPVEARNLWKTFGTGVVAVSGLDLRVERGAVYGLIGRNGAGKTTTLRLLMGLLRPDQGEARILGADLGTAPRPHRQKVAYVSQGQPVPEWMSLNDLCRYASHFYDAWDSGLAEDLSRRWELPRNQAIRKLSGGQQRLAALSVAFAAQPEVLLLDEPAAGLDPIARHSLNECLVEALLRGAGCTILLSTHLIGDLERLASHVGIMDRGRLVAEGQLEDWQRTLRRVQIVFPGETPPRGLSIPGSLRTDVLGPVVTSIARIASEDQLDSIRAMRGVRVNLFPLTLEEVFIELFRETSVSAIPREDTSGQLGGWGEAERDDRVGSRCR